MSSNKMQPDLISNTINQLSILPQGNDITSFTKQLVEIIKTNFGLYFVAIFLLEKEKEELSFSAGSGIVGEKLAKHRWRIPINNPYIKGTILAGDISLVSYGTQEISRYEIYEAPSGIQKLRQRMSESVVLPSPLLPDTKYHFSCQFKTKRGYLEY